MSFVPTPTQANASSQNAKQVVPPPVNAAAAAAEEGDMDAVFKKRTFDVYWVEKHALMYKDGITAVSIIYIFI